MEKIKLSNGIEVLPICYGSPIVLTYNFGHHGKLFKYKYWIHNFIKRNNQYKLDTSVKKIIKTSLKNGCTMVDTSRAYAGSEKLIGKVLNKYDRNKYIICTKLCNYHQYKNDVRDGLNTSLEKLGLDYVDIYLMHWPVEGKFIDSWKQMEELYYEGKCKAIGVCNFNIHHLEELKKTAKIMPMINQIECHPLFTQEELCNYCQENNIKVMAYTPTARMDARINKTCVPEIAKKYDKSIAQIILRWHVQLARIPVVNSTKCCHMLENLDIFDFSLTEDEIKKISKININSRLRFDPDNVDFKKI